MEKNPLALTQTIYNIDDVDDKMDEDGEDDQWIEFEQKLICPHCNWSTSLEGLVQNTALQNEAQKIKQGSAREGGARKRARRVEEIPED